MPSRNRPPIKTYEARSRIGLKLKIKQEAGLSKVVHNTALDPEHQPPPPPPPSSVLRAAEPSSRPPPTPPAPPGPGQMNGTVEHPSAKPPAPHGPRLPLRKTYRENVEALGTGTGEGTVGGGGFGGGRTRARGASSPPPLTDKVGEATSGLIRELAAVEDQLYQRMLKGGAPQSQSQPGAPGGSRTGEPAWEGPPLPPAKRRKSDSPDVDQASFSSDSPQDDTLTEHLQSAIDSILNLQQAPSRTSGGPHPTPTTPRSPPHRPEAYTAPSQNGGLGTRTWDR